MQNKKLDRTFYANPNVLEVAKQLLGKVLVSEYDGVACSGLIVETEAYRTPDDMSNHAVRFAHTKRGRDMVSKPGTAYVYYCRRHPLFNVCISDEKSGNCVLIRALEPLLGIELMQLRREKITDMRQLTNGPGKFTRALGITVEKTHHIDLCAWDSPVYICDPAQNETTIETSRRIRVEGAGRIADEQEWRFYVKGNKFVSELNYKWKNWDKIM